MNRHEYLLSSDAGDRPVLVLGHSLGTDFSLWKPVFGELEKRFKVLRFNPHPPPGTDGIGSIAGIGSDLLQLLDQLGLQQIDFCGLSMSGLLGQWLALEAPSRLRNLVLSNTSARIGSPETWMERIRLVRDKGLANVADDLASRWFWPPFAAEHSALVRQLANNLKSFPTEEYLAACEAIRDADLREKASQIKARTLIIAGTYDRAATVADAEFLKRQISDSRLLVLPCGHLACVELPERFIQAVNEFL
jgi:3-oxoadipate enol-lactonase